jgi:alkanesulfonate monooxygenase SsuD/methylene tetrahydromethanopterin reductase-like flavin-dependent oxidoreductase (luciferase family)
MRPATRFGAVWAGEPDVVARAENLGADSLWVGGHIVFRSPTTEPLSRLARLATLSKDIEIGTSIVLLPLYQPAVVAKQLVDLDQLTGGGRITLGIGVGGEYPPEFSACQVPLRGRGQRADEAITVMRKLWSGDVVDHDGPLFPMSGVQMEPPATPGGPPIVVAGRKPAAMARAAFHGDGWMPYLFSAERYARSRETITDLAATTGRNMSDFRWMSFCFVHIDSDGERARREAAADMGARYQQDMTQMIDRVALVGDIPEVARRIRTFIDAGVDHFVLAPIIRTEAFESLEVLFRDVLPLVKAER